MNLIEQRNIELLLQWRRKFHTEYVGVPMWPDIAQEWFDRDLRLKRIKAMDYLILRRKGNVVQFRKRIDISGKRL